VGVVAEVSTAAEAEVSTVVEAAASTVVALTAAIAAGVRCTAVAADMEGWAVEGRHWHAVPVEEELGPRRAKAFGTLRRDGIRLRDPEAAGAEMVRARPAFTQRLRMDSGIPSEAPTVRSDRG
jgi:hypothetical protein